MISVRNFRLGCNSHICSWQRLIFGEDVSFISQIQQTLLCLPCHTTTDSGCHQTGSWWLLQAFMTEKDIEFMSIFFFFFLQHIWRARNAQATPQHLGAASQADSISSSRGGQVVRPSLGHKCVWWHQGLPKSRAGSQSLWITSKAQIQGRLK